MARLGAVLLLCVVTPRLVVAFRTAPAKKDAAMDLVHGDDKGDKVPASVQGACGDAVKAWRQTKVSDEKWDSWKATAQGALKAAGNYVNKGTEKVTETIDQLKNSEQGVKAQHQAGELVTLAAAKIDEMKNSEKGQELSEKGKELAARADGKLDQLKKSEKGQEVTESAARAVGKAKETYQLVKDYTPTAKQLVYIRCCEVQMGIVHKELDKESVKMACAFDAADKFTGEE